MRDPSRKPARRSVQQLLGRARRAERDRQYRRRKARALAVAPVEFDGEMVNFLLKARWLFPHEVEDRVAIGEAIEQMVRDAMRR